MDCLFCKIVEGSIPSNKVLENDHVIVFHDISPLHRPMCSLFPRNILLP